MTAPTNTWPSGCHDTASCERHRICMYHQCRHTGKGAALGAEIDAAIAARGTEVQWKLPVRPEWVQGFAAAVAEVARTFGQQTIAKELMIGAGLTLADLTNAEVEAYDFDPIRRAMQ